MINLTIGDIRKYLENHNPPDDAIVLVERVEDVYFEKHGWETVKKPSSIFIGTDGYIKTFCAVKFKEDNNLYTNCHY